MPKTEDSVHAISIDYRCDWCRKGFMRSTGVSLTVNPPLFPHRCDNAECLRVQNMDRTFPYIEYRKKRIWRKHVSSAAEESQK